MPTDHSTRRLATFVALAFTVAACTSSRPEMSSESPEARIVDADVIRNDDDSYRLRWSVEPPGTAVAVFAGTTPGPTPGGTLVVETDASETTITGLDPSRRHYFQLVPSVGGPYVTATRFVHLEGARNFRDLGGYETTDGRRVRWGSVYRSDELTDLTDADVQRVGALGLQVVCDLRRESRRDISPDRLPTQDPPDTLHLDISAAVGQGSGSSFAEWSDEEAEAQFANRYALRMRTAGPLYGQMLDELGDPANRPFLFHCQGGKDRAGTAAALLLLALGVPEDIVMDDYLLTNEAYARTGFDPVRRATETGMSVAVLEVLRSARPVYLRAALDEMTAYSGSVDAYFRQALDLTDAERAHLRSELLH